MPPENDIQAEIEELEQRFAENSKGRVFAHLADAYRKAGEFSKAEGLILHGLKNHPNYISAYMVLGRVYLDCERFADAHNQFMKVLELDPQNLIALKALGDLAQQGRRLEDARSWYERVLQVDPRNEEAKEALNELEGGGPTAEPAADSAGAGSAPSVSPPEADMPGDAPAGAGDVQTPGASGQPAPEASQPGADEEGEEEEDMWPWERGADAGMPESGDVQTPPVEGLVTHEREDADAPVDDSDVMPWEQVGGPGSTEDEGAEMGGRPEHEAAADDTERIEAEGGAPEAGAPQAPTSEEPAGSGEGGSGDDLEFDVGDIDDWTPGFLRSEGADVGDDETVDFTESLTEEFEEGGAASEEEDEGEGMVTETMAELYAQQGLYDDALRVYHQLLEVRPNDERLRERVRDLEARKAGGTSDEAAAPPEGADELEMLASLDATEGGESGESEGGVEETGGPAADIGEFAPQAPESAPEDVAPRASDAETAAQGPSPGAGDGAFEFAAGAPQGDLSGQDPFASSFDELARKSGSAEAEMPADTPTEISPAEEAQPPVEPAGTGSAASAGPADARPAPSAEVPEAEPAVSQEGGEVETIEAYLRRLLEHPFDGGEPPADDSPSPPQDAAAAPDQEPTAEGEAGSEDLAQFQEWLRSLKR